MTVYTYSATESFGGNVEWVKVLATTGVLTGGNAAATTALDAIANLLHRTVQPMIVGAPYASGSGSAVLFGVAAGSVDAATMQTAVRATGLTGLTGATVTVSDVLVG